MRRPRYDHILASTALALILAAPVGAMARNIQVIPLPMPAPFKETSTQPPSATINPAIAPAAASPVTSTDPATVAEKAAAPDPLASLDPADRVIAEKIRDLLTTKGDTIFSDKKERAGVEAFYQSRNLMPLWLDKGVENARARAAIARLKNADADGLVASDYKTPNFAGPAPDARADAELNLTRAVLAYARHVQPGRFPYTRVSHNIELPQAPPEPAEILASMAAVTNAWQALDAFSPPHEGYQKLKAALAELRGKPASKEVSRQIDIVIANMERWRWYARDLGDAHVVVNQPDFTLKVMHNGTQVWTTRVVIGKPSMATPLLSETMKSFTVNPIWHVPPSIVHNEYLPAQRQDPTVLARMGLRVSYSGGDVQITMPSGGDNPLGRIRFNFFNRFMVYQHDTPDQFMFAQQVRAESHGCMRVQDPAKYAEVLLGIARPAEHWTAEKIKSIYGGAEQEIQLQPTPIWIHLTYQTAFADSAGKLQIRNDIYGLDSRTLAAIKSERAVVEPAAERKREPEVAATSHSARRSARSSRHAPVVQSTYDRPSSYARRASPSIFYR
jgi:murein L,D-transpeptidase YcbB/YkuD